MAATLTLATSAWAAGHDAHQAASASLPVSNTVTASDCWIRQMPAPAPSGGFLLFHNKGAQDVALTGVHAADYGHAMMHQTTEENGLSKMSMVHQVSLPAGADLAFKPGSYHLMLEQPRDGLAVGDHIPLVFTLADGSQVNAQCEIRSPKAMPGMDQHKH
ncbi:copper chaperone PCu(A)C [Castellaniella sp.]|uniref:copper chaperone PCu(A)C n=1 Tax=Castellaniella sp. TaxID=1955812 RepID=UPI002AFE4A5E|nr:copper chaperone PCu(A)C [Castellaniella sp.]